MHIALLYEHPTWSRALVERANERGFDISAIDVGDFDLRLPEYELGRSVDLWVNRVNAMPSAGRSASVVAATGHLLLALELQGQRVVNGSQTHRIGGSKAAQAALFGQLGLTTPAGSGISEPTDALRAARALGFPVLTKPNVGGSGSGIARYDDAAELQSAVEAGSVDLGVDGTGLVQRIIDSADGFVYRVEMLGSELFYATKQAIQVGAYNYCAADGYALDDDVAGSIQLFEPAPSIVESVAKVMDAAQTDLGGVEYLLTANSLEPSFYDFNPYSNFITGHDDQLGFNPIDRYLDFLSTL